MPNGNAFVECKWIWKWVEMKKKNSSHMIRFDSLRFSRMSRAHKIKFVFMHVVRYQLLLKILRWKMIRAHGTKDNRFLFEFFTHLNVSIGDPSIHGFYAKNNVTFITLLSIWMHSWDALCTVSSVFKWKKKKWIEIWNIDFR